MSLASVVFAIGRSPSPPIDADFATPDAKITIATVPDTLRRLNVAFRSGKTRNLAWRRSQLEKLRYSYALSLRFLTPFRELITVNRGTHLSPGRWPELYPCGFF